MKKGILVIFIAMLVLACCPAGHAEAAAPVMSPSFIMAEPGESVQFSYTVPDGFETNKAVWSWNPAFTTDGSRIIYRSVDSGEGVVWDDNGKIALPENSMAVVGMNLNEIHYIYGFVAVPASASAFEYTIANGEATIIGRDDSKLSNLIIIPPEIDGCPVTAIGERAFYGLPSGVGSYIYIPDSVLKLGKEAFGAGAYISMVYLSNNLQEMGKGAFAACLQMTDIRVPSSLKVIPDEAFANCWMLGSIHDMHRLIGQNTTRIGERAFVGCHNLKSGDGLLPASLKEIGEGAFWGCSGFTRITLPESVDIIRDRTFLDCKNLQSVEFDGNVKQIGSSAFENCQVLESIDLLSLRSLGSSALKGCTSLSSISLGSDLSYIGTDAFYGCTGVEAFHVAEQNNAYSVFGGALMNKAQTHLLAYPGHGTAETFIAPVTMKSAESGAFHSISGLKELTLPEGFSDYKEDMFLNSTGLEKIYFPENTLTNIPAGFFHGCTNLVYPTEYTDITGIGKEAFRNCSSLPSVSFDDQLSSVDIYAFDGCTLLESASLGTKASSLGIGIFRNCKSLMTFTVPENLEHLPNQAFQGCSSLKNVVWNRKLVSIGTGAFEKTALTELALPKTVTTISNSAFAQITALETALLHEGITTLGTSAFAGSGLKSIVLPESLTKLGNAAFMNCKALESVQLPSSMFVIPISFFEGCESLTAPVLPEALRTINQQAFAGCTALERLILPKQTAQIAADAFQGCTGLTLAGWTGTPAQAAASAGQIPFEALDEALIFLLNAEKNGYLVAGCDPDAYELSIPAAYNELPVTGIQPDAFGDCLALTSITVAEENESLQARNGILYTIDGKTLLLVPANWPNDVLDIDEKVTAIGDYAFAHNQRLLAVNIGDQVQSIGSRAFSNVHDALTIFAPKNSMAHQLATAAGIPCITPQMQFTYRVENEKACITGYTGTDTVVSIPAFIDGYPVYKLEKLNAACVETLIIGNSVEILGDSAFKNLTQLKKVTLAEGLLSIGSEAFRGCTALTEINLPASLTAIGSQAFQASGITSLHIPSSVTTIGNGFAGECKGLISLSVDQANTRFSMDNGMLYDLSAKALIYCLPGISGQVTVKDGTEYILAYVFQGFDEITSIALPGSLRRIHEHAFEACDGLTSVTLPDGLVQLDTYAFAYCRQLNEIILPDSLTQIKEGVFYNCSALTSIAIPKNIKSLYGTFMYCSALTDVTLPEGLTQMINGVFKGCRSLKSLHFPSTLASYSGELPAHLETITVESGSVYFRLQNGVLYDLAEQSIFFVNKGILGDVVISDGITSIAAGAFSGCTGITSIVLPEGLTSIESEAFRGCTGLSQATFPSTLETIGSKAFRGTGMKKLAFTNGSLRYIGSFAFAECPDLEEVNITLENLSLDEYLFFCCPRLKTAVLPKKVARMAGGSFNECTALESVTLPENITAVGGFEKCESLKSITLPASTTTIHWNAFNSCISLTEIILPDGVTEIGNNAFAYCTALAKADLPTGLKTLGEGAFQATAIEKVVLPNGMMKIPANAFANCSKLASASIPDSVSSIGYDAFAHCGLLQDAALPASLTELGEFAFAETGLMHVTVPEGVSEIGASAFYNCSKLESLVLSVGVESIQKNAFDHCTALKTITLSNTLKEIGSDAFSHCTALTKFTCDTPGILRIESRAFLECDTLSEISVSEQLNYVGDSAFYNCKKLRRVSSAANKTGAQLQSVTYIGKNAFFQCTALPGVVMGDVLETVGDYAFDTTRFTSISFPDGLTSLGRNVIWRNPNLTHVHLPDNLQTLPPYMFNSSARLEKLTLPAGLKTIDTGAFRDSTSLGALVLPDGLETIGFGAFQQAEMHLYIPDSVTTIQQDAFDDAKVIFYCSANSYAAQFAAANDIPVRIGESIPDVYLQNGAQVAASIVSQLITDDMTDYQKAEVLVDWMLDNVTLDDSHADSISSKQALLIREASRWGWSYGYKELLRAAGLTTDIYLTAEGYIEEEAISSSGSITITYFTGEAVNMIKINGEWYFTHPAFTHRFGKADYFMLNRDRYYCAFGEYPQVPDCDGYEQTYLYQEFSRDIEQDVTEFAGKEFECGQKLVFADVDTQGIPYPDAVMDYAGRHMDTHDWHFEGEAFEPCIIGTLNGYWLSGDLTGEYAQVDVENTRIHYGEQHHHSHHTYKAKLCGYDVEGELKLEEVADHGLYTLARGKEEQEMPLTRNKTYLATFTPMLSSYIDTLAPTTFTLTVECVLPPVTDPCTATRQSLSFTRTEDYLLPENAMLEIIITPAEEGAEPITLQLEDNPEQYQNGVYAIPFTPGMMPCEKGYTLSVRRTAEGCTASETLVIAVFEASASHTGVTGTVTPATLEADGCITPLGCETCGTAIHSGGQISRNRILQLPMNLKEIDEEAFFALPIQQVILPANTTTLGSRSFADCPDLLLVHIPDSVAEIANDAFAGSENVLILCSENSAAHAFAAEKKLPWLPVE